MAKKFLTLAPENQEINSPSKVINSDGSITSFNSGLMFCFCEYEYNDKFHTAIKLVLEDKNSFMILGKLNDFGEAQMEIDKSMVRRKKDKGDGLYCTVEMENENNIMVLDLDDHYVEGWNPLDPEITIKEWLKEHKINCDVTWQITSSQKLDTDLMRVRLYFLCDKEYSLEYRKAFATSKEIGADGCVFSSNQPIYTTPPTFENDAEDFIPERHGFLKGERRTFELPEFTPAEIKEKIQGEYSGYDYTGELPAEVLNGSVYRRFFMPYAFSLANKGIAPDDIALLIQVKTGKTPREYNDDNVRAYIADACARIELEVENRKVENVDPEEIEISSFGDPFTRHDWASGFLGEFQKEILKRMPWPNKEIAIFAGRCVIATLMGRRFSYKGLNLNQNNVMLGAQGIGKETINWTLNMIISQLCEHKKMAGPKIRKFLSGQAPKGITALHRNMSRAPSAMVLISEAGQNTKSSSGDPSAVRAYTLTNFAVGAHSPLVVNDLSIPLPEVYGTNVVRVEESEINSYAHNFTSDLATSGEMARKNHHFLDTEPNEYPDSENRHTEFPGEIILTFWQIVKHAMEGEDFSLVKKFGKDEWTGPTLEPLKEESRIEVAESPEAKEKMELAISKEYDIRKNKKIDSNTTEWARLVRNHEKILREALLYASIDKAIGNTEVATISLENYVEAEKYICECDRSTEQNSYLFKSGGERLVEEILKSCLESEDSKGYKSNHKPAYRKHRLFKHSFIFGGNRKPKRLARQIAAHNENSIVTSEKIVTDAYKEGEQLGYWEIVDGAAYNAVETFAKLGIRKDKKRYIMIMAVSSVKK